MSAVLRSLIHLFLRSAQLVVSARSSSFSAVGLSILGFTLREVFAFYRSGWDWRAMRAKWARNVKDGMMVVIGLWAVIFACSIAVTVYADHQDLLARIRALNADKQNQATETQRKLTERDKMLSDAKKRIDDLEKHLDMEKGRKS